MYGKIVQVIMGGSSGVSIPAGTVILSGLPTPQNPGMYPTIDFADQTIDGLLYISKTGELGAYSGNKKALASDVYSIVYIAE